MFAGREFAPSSSNISLSKLSPAVYIVAAAKFLLTVAFSNQYGFHRDEMYYLASARYPALAYVDDPPAHIAPGQNHGQDEPV